MVGARTPEELETLFEDALVLEDGGSLAALFEPGAVLAVNDEHPAHGESISRAAFALWGNGQPYVADPRQVVVARDVALIVGERGVNVARRDRDGGWRYAIVQQSVDRNDGRIGKGDGTMAVETSPTQGLQPVAVGTHDGGARWWLGSLAVIKVTAAETGGLMSIIEVTDPPGSEVPWHVHHREDEGFWILEGSATFQVGDVTIEAGVGDYLFGPRGIPHRYSVGDAGCRMLFLMTPGGFENLVIGMSEPATSRSLPPPSNEEPDWELVAAVAAANGCELLG